MNKLKSSSISELVDVFNNIRIPLSSKERENLEKVYPYYGAQNIVDYVDKYLFDGQYILIAEDGENLRSNNQNICNLVNGKFWVNNHAHIAKANSKNVTKYLYYNFNRIKFEQYVTGSAQPNLNKENLLNIKTYVHDYFDQQKIAKVLSDLDAKIELNNKINTELEAMAKTLYDYWFVQFDFPVQSKTNPELIEGYKTSGGKMVWSEELKREIPEGWGVGKLDDLGEIIGGSTPSKAVDDNFCYDVGTPWITPKDLSNNKGKKYITRGEYDVTERGLKEASLKIMPKGTILLSSRAPIGYLAIARTNVTTNQGFKSFVPKNIFSSEFIFFSIQSLIPEIEANSSGSTFKEVSTSTLRTIKTILPTENILLAFDILIKPIFKKQDCVELENQELASLRDWLLPMLMNGQVTVGELVEATEKGYKVEDNDLGMVAESTTEIKSEKQSKVISLKPTNVDIYKRTLLAAEIVFQLHKEATLGHLKLQKLLYLCQEINNMNLPMNFLKQAMGPYDNRLMRSLDKQFEEKKWFKFEKNEYLKYKPLVAVGSHQKDYLKYFDADKQKIDYLISTFRKYKSQDIEAVATLYACWKEAIENKELINLELILKKFYRWSKEKEKFNPDDLKKHLNWMKNNGIYPR